MTGLSRRKRDAIVGAALVVALWFFLWISLRLSTHGSLESEPGASGRLALQLEQILEVSVSEEPMTAPTAGVGGGYFEGLEVGTYVLRASPVAAGDGAAVVSTPVSVDLESSVTDFELRLMLRG